MHIIGWLVDYFLRIFKTQLVDAACYTAFVQLNVDTGHENFS